MTDTKLVTDSLTLATDGMTEADGILSVPVVVARAMILDYSGLKVLKPAEELKEAAMFADGIPVTREHPEAGIVTDRGEVLGFLRDPLFENDELKGVLDIANKDLIADIKDGKVKEVSGGFFCNIDHTPGVYGDSKYSAVQRSIFMNHVAIVDAGRCSIKDGCGLNLDSMTDKLKTVTAERDALQAATSKDLKTMMTERDNLRAELDSIVQVDKDAIIKELTSLQESKTKADLDKLRLDELKLELDMVRELRTGRLVYSGGNNSSSAIDAAYAGR